MFAILKPGGYLVFTDTMQSDTCDQSQMHPMYHSLSTQGVQDMGSVHKYKK